MKKKYNLLPNKTIKKYVKLIVINFGLITISACSLHPPTATDLPPALRKNVFYLNMQPNSSFDSQLNDFFSGMEVNLSSDIDRANSSLTILKLQSASTQPSLADSSQTTSISYTLTVSYSATNLVNGQKFGPMSVSSSISSLIGKGQLYSSGDHISIEQRLQYNCILEIFNQLSSENSWQSLNPKPLLQNKSLIKNKASSTRYTKKHLSINNSRREAQHGY